MQLKSSCYACAREALAYAHVEEMLDVARRKAKTSEEVQSNRLLVDTLKWRAAKMKPKHWGDKLTLEGDISVRTMTDAQINARIAHLLTQRAAPLSITAESETEDGG